MGARRSEEEKVVIREARGRAVKRLRTVVVALEVAIGSLGRAFDKLLDVTTALIFTEELGAGDDDECQSG